MVLDANPPTIQILVNPLSTIKANIHHKMTLFHQICDKIHILHIILAYLAHNRIKKESIFRSFTLKISLKVKVMNVFL